MDLLPELSIESVFLLCETSVLLVDAGASGEEVLGGGGFGLGERELTRLDLGGGVLGQLLVQQCLASGGGGARGGARGGGGSGDGSGRAWDGGRTDVVGVGFGELGEIVVVL